MLMFERRLVFSVLWSMHLGVEVTTCILLVVDVKFNILSTLSSWASSRNVSSLLTRVCVDSIASYHGHLLLWLSHVVIVVNLCCAEGLMEDRCISNKHSR